MYNKIKAAVIAHDMKMQDFWAITGYTPSSLMRRCEKGKLTVEDVKNIIKALGLTRDEALQIFFEGTVA